MSQVEEEKRKSSYIGVQTGAVKIKLNCNKRKKHELETNNLQSNFVFCAQPISSRGRTKNTKNNGKKGKKFNSL